MDNIDVQYGRDKGLHVINTPAASSQSVGRTSPWVVYSLWHDLPMMDIAICQQREKTSSKL